MWCSLSIELAFTTGVILELRRARELLSEASSNPTQGKNRQSVGFPPNVLKTDKTYVQTFLCTSTKDPPLVNHLFTLTAFTQMDVQSVVRAGRGLLSAGAQADTLPLRVVAVFIILVAGLAGGIPPLFMKVRGWVREEVLGLLIHRLGGHGTQQEFQDTPTHTPPQPCPYTHTCSAFSAEVLCQQVCLPTPVL
jgi:hypothetical protein